MKVFPWLLPSLLVTVPVFAEGIATDGSLGAVQNLVGTNVTIPQELGKTVGNNLFHSFSDFNINTGQTVAFSGSDSLQNVISRVTGNNPSIIDGTLKSDIKNADFYFINPHGITFNTNAQVDVPAAFHVSTADKMDFGKNGGVFYVDLTKDSQLSTEPPSAFGFLGNSTIGNGFVNIDNAHLQMKDGKTFDVVSGDIGVEGKGFNDNVTGESLEPTVKSTGGEVRLVAFTGLGNVSLQRTEAGILPLPSEDNATQGGDVFINGGYVDTSGNGSGRIDILGNNIQLTNSGVIKSDNNGDANASQLSGININTNNLYLNDGSNISSSAINPIDDDFNPMFIAKGNAGNITISANNSVKLTGILDNPSRIESNTSSDGNAGEINIMTKNFEIIGSDLTSRFLATYTNAGRPILTNGVKGTVNIEVSEYMKIYGMPNLSNITADIINIVTKYLDMKGGRISTTQDNELPLFTNGVVDWSNPLIRNGKAGDIKIFASESIFMDTMFNEKGDWIGWTSGISADTSNDDNAGNIFIKTKELVLIGSMISSSANTPLKFTTNFINNLEQQSFPTGQIVTNGGAGTIDIIARSIKLNAIESSDDGKSYRYSSHISTDTNTNGNAGLIRINTENLELIDSEITSNAIPVYLNDFNEIIAGKEPSFNVLESNGGNAGNIMINANNLILKGNNILNDSINTSTVISSSIYSKFGAAGEVNVDANKISLYDRAEISSASKGDASSGKTGDINIKTQDLMMEGGIISIENEALISDSNQQELTSASNKIGNINLDAQNVSMDNAQITSASAQNIPSGNINIIVSNYLEMKNNSFITTTSNTGDGGSINVHAGDVTYLQDSGFITTVKGGQGNGGDISARINVLVMDKGIIQANAVSGNGGKIQLALEAIIPSRNVLIQGGKPIVWNTSPTNINLIQAASENGVSGTVNNSAPQLNLSGVLANITNSNVDNNLISQDYCALGQGSSLSKKGKGALPMRPKNFQSF